ncbi:MAG: Oleandomycin glycosyltransferase [Deltaproteobacteria bacterium]|nr:Oleandomycin glycosyltransferase [Deltaproteobacteria bacterium]
MENKVIAFFPEAAFGPALNSVGIAQACEKLGHKAVFLTDPGMQGVYSGYGFDEHTVNMSEPMPPEEMAKYWTDFINGHIPNFDLTAYEQIDNYVKECWEAIVDTAIWAEKELPGVLEDVSPDIVCVDNVILFPAIKRYAFEHNKPWVRVISCSENEIPDPAIPPHLSGCGEKDNECFESYQKHFNDVIRPTHEKFNQFLVQCGEAAYPLGEFFEASPHMNLLLYPEPVKFRRSKPLDSKQFQYLEGCVREEEVFEVPVFKSNNNDPLLYVSFGSLGSGDTVLLKRLMEVVANMQVRALFNMGEYESEYDEVPDNIHIASWYPQPSVISQADAVIHHGGNNSFNECLYFGKPALIMPYVWDGHDNARRVAETGHGYHLHRNNWTSDELRSTIENMLTNQQMLTRLAATSARMRSEHGPTKAAAILNRL